MNNELKISGAELRDGDKQMTLRVKLQNSGDRTMHAYTTVRALRYDVATNTLHVQLSDRGLQEMSPGGNFLLPSFTSIDPHSETTLDVSLPRTIARLKPGVGEVSPIVEELPAYQAEHIQIEVAYGKTPFYRDERPRTGKTPRQMMVDWADGHATHKLTRNRPRPSEQHL